MHAGAVVTVANTSVSVPEGNEGERTTVDVCVELKDAMNGLERNIELALNVTSFGTSGMCMQIA